MSQEWLLYREQGLCTRPVLCDADNMCVTIDPLEGGQWSQPIRCCPTSTDTGIGVFPLGQQVQLARCPSNIMRAVNGVLPVRQRTPPVCFRKSSTGEQRTRDSMAGTIGVSPGEQQAQSARCRDTIRVALNVACLKSSNCSRQ